MKFSTAVTKLITCSLYFLISGNALAGGVHCGPGYCLNEDGNGCHPCRGKNNKNGFKPSSATADEDLINCSNARLSCSGNVPSMGTLEFNTRAIVSQGILDGISPQAEFSAKFKGAGKIEKLLIDCDMDQPGPARCFQVIVLDQTKVGIQALIYRSGNGHYSGNFYVINQQPPYSILHKGGFGCDISDCRP